jgi:type I protein arginine methyltransferase
MYDHSHVRVVNYHFSMLQDTARVAQFQRALAATVRPGDVALDVGSGTGLLAYLALANGAAHVYAVEMGPIMDLARQIAQANGYAEHITWLRDKSTRVTLPEQVDVIVSETIGNFGLDEGIVKWVRDAAARHLKPGGRIIPQALTLFAAPLELPEAYAQVAAWDTPVADIDYAAAGGIAANQLHWVTFGAEATLSPGQPWASVTLHAHAPKTTRGSACFVCEREGTLHGIGGWFTAALCAGIEVSNAPDAPTTSWSRVFLPLRRPVALQRGDQVEVVLSAHVNGSLWRWAVRCTRPTANGATLLAATSQDTFAGQLLAAQTLQGRAAHSAPALSTDGEVERFILNRMNGRTPLEEIARQAAARFPTQFPRWEDALARAGEVAARWRASMQKRVGSQA